MHGLDLYDYSARYYDSNLGRFSTMNPLAEKYYSCSLYVYVMNNPLRFIDPNGKDGWDVFGGTIDGVVANFSLPFLSIDNTEKVTSVSDYNRGRDLGDLASIVMGGIEIVVGGRVAAQGAVTTAATGGKKIE